MGRARKSELLDNLQGNPGRRKKTGRKNGNFSQRCSKKKFGMPRGLPKVVRDKAREFGNHLVENRVAVEMYRSTFERYCLHLVAVHTAEQELAKWVRTNGRITVVSPTGVIQKHPASMALKDHSAAAMAIEIFFSRLLKDVEPEADVPKDTAGDFLTRAKRPKVVKGGLR